METARSGESKYFRADGSLFSLSRTKLWRALGARERTELFSEPEPNSGCWLWLGARLVEGYGKMAGMMASRYSYIAFRGPIPRGLTIDHLCRTPACVNPAHLEPVTNKVNILRGTGPAAENARKTTCPLGHDLGEPNAWGHRSCRVCTLQYMKNYNATQRPNAREDTRLRMRRWRAKKKQDLGLDAWDDAAGMTELEKRMFE